MNLEIRAFQDYPKLSQETQAFTAELWIAGKLTAQVENDGHGGSNMYRFTAEGHTQERAFYDYARQWGAENQRSFEPADALVEHLAIEAEFREAMRADGIKRGIVIKRGGETSSFGGDAYDDEISLVELPDGEDAAALAAAEQAEAWYVLEATV